MALKTGRPRRMDSDGFRRRFAMLLPALNEGIISKGEMARELEVSRRSLDRYLNESEVTTN